MKKIPIIKNPKNSFVVARIHYNLDPQKRSLEWKEKTQKGMPASGWLREYEIDYSTFAGKPVFPEFNHELNVRQLERPEKQILYIGWDFGYHRPAVLISSVNQFDQWLWHKAILGQDEGIEKFGQRVQEYLLSEYPSCRFIHACDPAGHQKTDKAEVTSVDVLNSLNIYPQSKVAPINEGVEIIRKKLLMRDDGKVGLMVNQTENDLIDGLKGGYRYPEKKEGREEKENPLKDGYYDHFFDAGRYIAVNHFSLVGEREEPNPITQEFVSSGSLENPNQNILPEGQGIGDLF